MQHENWDCAEAVKSNRRAQVFLTHQDKFLQADLEGIRKSFAQILDSIAHLWHRAMHRLRISAKRLEQFIINAEALARLLHHEYSLQPLTRIRMDP
jgi:hypothetical protein